MQKGVKLLAANEKGVTLMELLVVLTIIGVIVAIGVNMMGGVISKQRLRTAAGEVQTRLKVAQMLSVVKNKSVTVVFTATAGTDSGQEDSYIACLDNDYDGDCTDEPATNYLNLDTGKSSNLELATKTMHRFVEMYGVDFGDGATATTNAVTFKPPSGLPRTIEGGVPPGLVNGAVCLKVDAGDDDLVFRRVTVDPLVGKTNMWRGLITDPTCDSQLPDGDPSAEWEKVH